MLKATVTYIDGRQGVNRETKDVESYSAGLAFLSLFELSTYIVLETHIYHEA